MWRCSLVAFSLSVACQFDRPGDVMPVDARTVDAAPTCAADTITCAAGTYVECGPDGFATRTLTCPLGCATDVAKCLDIDPHNGLATYLDMVAAPPDVVLHGKAVFMPASGTIFDDGTSIQIPMFTIDDRLRVYVVASLTIDGGLSSAPGDTFDVYGHPIAIVSRGDIIIRGPIDLSASGPLAGPGGWPGTDLQHSQATPCIAPPAPGFAPSPGGGGGGGAFDGASGGGINQVAGGIGGIARDATEPLRGGCAGGGVNTGPETFGGGGGGGLQLASRTQIRIENNGSIDASGGGGSGGRVSHGGAGGGGGGTILLEAPQIVLVGSVVVLSTKGGGGGGAASGTAVGLAGGDGGLDAQRAPGGTSPAGNGGGRGGLDLAPEGGADAAGGNDSGGGGGGAPGTIRLATSVGTVIPSGGASIRGVKRDEVLRTRQVP